MEFKLRNVNDGYATMIPWLLENGDRTESRNGPVIRAPGPVVWEFSHPRERVLLDPKRNANPFFHLYEGIWMIFGSNNVAPLTHFVKRMVDFTDNGHTVPGAYGHRLQGTKRARTDQWLPALWALNTMPETRRVVLAMYDPTQDQKALMSGGNDLPCNTHMYLSIRQGSLDMTICNRSNDIEWGALGANAVHFSMMQEWASDILSVPVGILTTFSNNLHKYLDRDPSPPAGQPDPYTIGSGLDTVPMNCSAPGWSRDMKKAAKQGWLRNLDYDTEWFQTVFKPMMLAHNQYKDGAWDSARDTIEAVISEDWRIAGRMWLDARQPTES